MNIQPIGQRLDGWQLSMGPLAGWRLLPTEISGKSDREFNGKQLKADKVTRFNYRRDMTPEIISLLELRDKIHPSPCGLLTMPRCQIISDNTTESKSMVCNSSHSPGADQIKQTASQTPGSHFQAAAELQLGSDWDKLPESKIKGEESHPTLVCLALGEAWRNHKESKWDWKRKIISYTSQLEGPKFHQNQILTLTPDYA